MNPLLVGGIIAAIAWVLSRGKNDTTGTGGVSHPFQNLYANQRVAGGTAAPGPTGSGGTPAPAAAYSPTGGVGMSPNVFPFGPMQSRPDGSVVAPDSTDAGALGVPSGPSSLPVSRFMGGRGNVPIAKKRGGGCDGCKGGCKSSCALDCPPSNTFSDGRSPIRVTGPGTVLGDVIADTTVPSFYDPTAALDNYDAYTNSLLSAESNQVLSGAMSQTDAFNFYSAQLEKLNAAATYGFIQAVNPYQIGYQGPNRPRSVDLPTNQAPGAINPLLTFSFDQQQTLNAIVSTINKTSHLFPQQQEYEYLRAAGLDAGSAVYMAMMGSHNGVLPTPAPEQPKVTRQLKFGNVPNPNVGRMAVTMGAEFWQAKLP